jgi:hypothetical protein
MFSQHEFPGPKDGGAAPQGGPRCLPRFCRLHCELRFCRLSSPPTLLRETLSISIPCGSFLLYPDLCLSPLWELPLYPCLRLSPLLTAKIRGFFSRIGHMEHIGCQRCIIEGGWSIDRGRRQRVHAMRDDTSPNILTASIRLAALFSRKPPIRRHFVCLSSFVPPVARPP